MFIQTTDGSRLMVETSHSKYYPATAGSYEISRMRVEGRFVTVLHGSTVAHWCVTFALDGEQFNLDYIEGVEGSGDDILDTITWQSARKSLQTHVADPIRNYLRLTREGLQDHIDNDRMGIVRGMV